MKTEQYGAALAACYDRFNDGVDYGELCAFVKKLFSEHCEKEPKNVCEIACGTGSLSIELAKSGYKVTASDISEEMLTVADKKARDGGADVRFVRADMRSFLLYTKADAVVCFFDSINYLTKPDDVKECFASTYNALADEGLFVFDINSKHKFENVYGDNAYVIESGDDLLAWQNYYNEKSRMCDFYLSMFFPCEDGRYERCDEYQREKMYTRRQIEKYASESGFEILGVYSDFDMSEADENSCERIYFVCKKA